MNRADRLIPIVLAVVAVACVVLAIEPWPVGVFQDDGIYVVLAKALAAGEGYRFIQMPGAPHATHYPPGYPLFLAALWKLAPAFPANVTVFKFANAALVGGTAALTWRFARGYAGLGPLGAGAVTLLFTACSPVVLLSVMVLSEPLFMFGLLLALAAGERAEREGSVRSAALAGMGGAALAMVRTLGVLVVPAVVAALAVRRRWRAAGVALGAGIAGMIPWQLWVTAHAHEVPDVFVGKYGSYGGWLAEAVRTGGVSWVLEVMRYNAGRLAFETWTHTGTVHAPAWLRIAATSLVAVILVAGIAVAWRRVRVTTCFVVAYVAIVLAWPFAPARFLWGIWPVVGVIAVLGVTGLDGAVRRLPHLARPARAAVALAATCLVVGYLKFNVQSAKERWWSQVQGSVALRSRPMAEWVTANTPSTAVLATDDDLLLHLYTGRQTVPNGMFTPQEHLVPQTPAFATAALREIMAAYPVDYVLAVSDYGLFAATGLLRDRTPALRLLTALERGAVFAPVRAPAVDRP